MDLRVGTGLDFHRLIVDPGRPLILGGFVIEDDLALEGHSDADVILHAISDAILGALGLGDIGFYFPDTDPALKGMDSRRIIHRALTEVSSHRYELANMDVTIIGERPKILPHRAFIQESLCEITGLEKGRIGLKATTTEKMGALGRKEGVGCMATISLVRYSDEEG